MAAANTAGAPSLRRWLARERWRRRSAPPAAARRVGPEAAPRASVACERVRRGSLTSVRPLHFPGQPQRLGSPACSGGSAGSWIRVSSFSSIIGGLVTWLLAWLARKPPTFVHHFPAIHGDSAQTEGTVLLSIVSSSLPHRLQHVKHTLTFCTPAGGTNTSSCQPGRDTLSHFQHATSTGMYD